MSSGIIDYRPEKRCEFHSYGYEYIDNRHFVLSPEVVFGTIEKAAPYVEQAKRIFSAPVGIAVWHVKQSEDGISYLLSPIALPFEEFPYANQA